MLPASAQKVGKQARSQFRIAHAAVTLLAGDEQIRIRLCVRSCARVAPSPMLLRAADRRSVQCTAATTAVWATLSRVGGFVRPRLAGANAAAGSVVAARRPGAAAFGSDANAQVGHRPLTDAQRQRTFIALKPDCVQRNLCGEVLGRFERKGFKMRALKLVLPSRELAEAHYAEHRDKSFFPRACRFLCSGPVVATVWEGLDVIAVTRKQIGATNPVDSAVGTIRGDFASHFRRNLVHGSDSVESAEREIALWFRDEEV